ncbi:hypothetical protein QAD02_017921 [Eretmocerus hayati]|uniref:Uncharacterized protein n=1 Tax=Eretmocerus hayati TaxID=131215 RepID=A0ACC2PHR4_9HYME|nr:hypothetical protein QAD02_017921 [Eretmocerus hayati]
MSRRNTFNSVVILTTLCIQINAEQGDLIDILLNKIQNDVYPYKVNTIIEDIDQLSPLANTIIERTNQAFKSNIILADDLMQIYASLQTKEQKADYIFKRMAEKDNLLVGIVELKHNSEFMKRISAMLKYFVIFNPLLRGKYLMHLITSTKVDMEVLFQLAWSMDFLDLTVVEWTQGRPYTNISIESKLSLNNNASVNSYNPFSAILSKTKLDNQTQLFPKNDKNCYGFPYFINVLHDDARLAHAVNIKNISWKGSGKFTHMTLTQILSEVVNCNLTIIVEEEPSKVLPQPYEKFKARIGLGLPEDLANVYDELRTDYSQEIYFLEQINYIYVPIPSGCYFYIMRKKVYEIDLSLAAIGAFALLFFTAFIFSNWAKLIGFQVRDWLFLDIFTAQMGGSFGPRGRMRLSEKIYKMSIYIATFIIVTLGTDYMLEIFIIRQNLPEIKTIEDLVESGMKLRVDSYTHRLLRDLATDDTLKRILERMDVKDYGMEIKKFRDLDSFCYASSRNSASFDETINCCILLPRERWRGLFSDEKFQVDKIEDTIALKLPGVELPWPNKFLAKRFERSIACQTHAILHYVAEIVVLESLSLQNVVIIFHDQKESTKEKILLSKILPLLRHYFVFTSYEVVILHITWICM